ncbi:DUF6777 domain-containing protein [Streptomyces sp. NPDC090025]|uniref:DUF6777 domain-containing protein n=1 Tax=Streptomyces sp. NPDC090025 TaxID=3365922 RepID=UPI003837A9BF
MRDASRRRTSPGPGAPRRATRRHRPQDRPGPAPRPLLGTFAALAAATLLLAGCSGGDPGEPGAEQNPAAAPAREVLLQPAGSQGPAPFTASTAQEGVPVSQEAPPVTGVTDPVPAGRTLTGATPGLYGGTRSVASCNVDQQAAYLAAEPAKARAFAESAGIPENNLGGWLRGLTPVLLRADTRVTGHGFADGRATAFQTVLQAGTAVLVDEYGTPRVRCACGNPLRSPAATAEGAAATGEPWAGYRPDRVVVITPTTGVVGSLVIASAADNTWLERRTGSDGEQDRRPDVLPPCDPASCDLVANPPDPVPDGDPAPRPPATGGHPPVPHHTPAAPREPQRSEEPAAPPVPDHGTTAPHPDVPAVPDPPDAPAVPDGPGEPPPPEPPPSFDEVLPGDPVPQQPETFEG